MIVRHCNYQSRTRDDFAVERISKSDCCGSKKRESDEISRGEHFHTSTHIDHLYFATRIVAGCAVLSSRFMLFRCTRDPAAICAESLFAYFSARLGCTVHCDFVPNSANLQL